MADENVGGGAGGAGAAGGGAAGAGGGAPPGAGGTPPGAGGAPPGPIIGGAGGNEFLSSLPEDLRGEASLQSIKDLPSLAKSFVHAQRLVGADKLALPKADANPAEWEAVYNRLGRPEKADGYKFTEVKLPDGFEVDKKLQDRFAPIFHKHGLTQKQADGMRSDFMQYQIETIQASIQNQNQAHADGEKALKAEWGDKYDANVKQAELALRRFATPDLLEALNESGLGSHPGIVKAFAEIGARMSEDQARGGGSGGPQPVGVDAAKTELARLTKDADFQKALQDRWHKDHGEAVKKWTDLHRQAAPQQ